MKKRLWITIMIALAAGSVSAETYIESKAAFKVPVGQKDQDDAAGKIDATVGKEFVITLESNATTGYEWQIAEPIDEKLISVVSSDYLPNNTALAGSGGNSSWTFKAVKAGNARIAFKYVRPWEKDIPPVRMATYTVNIQESVKELEATEDELIDSASAPAPEPGEGGEIKDEELVDSDS